MKILLIEDEKQLVEVITDYLRNEGYAVKSALNGIEAISLFKAEEFDFVIMDLMLPDIHGEDLCMLIRQSSQVPIIMLTAKTNIEDRLTGLSIGADDYITKPFSLRELVMRIKTISKRVYNGKLIDILSFDNSSLVIDKASRTVKKDDEEIYLTKIEFDILIIFAENPNRTFTREQLIEFTMGYDYIGYDRTIDTHIKNIRKKIESDHRSPNYIKTIYGVGYKFTPKN